MSDALAGHTLAMDAADGSGTLALLHDGTLHATRDVVMRSAEEERFFPAVVDVLHEVGLEARDLDRIVCGAGPGSFTALRVVGAVAKGLAVAADIPVFALPSLALMVAADDAARRAGGRWLATLDALRGERYAALVVLAGKPAAVLTVESLGRLPSADIPARAAALGAVPTGPDEVHRAAPHARGVEGCAGLLAAMQPVDLAAWEPSYGRLAEAQVQWEAAHGRELG